eukprot:TRINITY_DN5225_c0_g1_i2.p1 TRINITY_DN5225_c0_g1~~TRINITY_DN5225_c0_g1_i2.p1  ORF type:complete len:326 (-),score=9.64 TRINITY_DN5225_c0_g1_i2:39-1016(-)
MLFREVGESSVAFFRHAFVNGQFSQEHIKIRKSISQRKRASSRRVSNTEAPTQQKTSNEQPRPEKLRRKCVEIQRPCSEDSRQPPEKNYTAPPTVFPLTHTDTAPMGPCSGDLRGLRYQPYVSPDPRELQEGHSLRRRSCIVSVRSCREECSRQPADCDTSLKTRLQNQYGTIPGPHDSKRFRIDYSANYRVISQASSFEEGSTHPQVMSNEDRTLQGQSWISEATQRRANQAQSILCEENTFPAWMSHRAGEKIVLPPLISRSTRCLPNHATHVGPYIKLNAKLAPKNHGDSRIINAGRRPRRHLNRQGGRAQVRTERDCEYLW